MVLFSVPTMLHQCITAATTFAPELVFIDTHANPDTQRDNLVPDISLYADNNVSNGDSKTDFSKGAHC